MFVLLYNNVNAFNWNTILNAMSIEITFWSDVSAFYKKKKLLIETLLYCWCIRKIYLFLFKKYFLYSSVSVMMTPFWHSFARSSPNADGRWFDFPWRIFAFVRILVSGHVYDLMYLRTLSGNYIKPSVSVVIIDNW